MVSRLNYMIFAYGKFKHPFRGVRRVRGGRANAGLTADRAYASEIGVRLIYDIEGSIDLYERRSSCVGRQPCGTLIGETPAIRSGRSYGH
jgi:hypothetical protein